MTSKVAVIAGTKMQFDEILKTKDQSETIYFYVRRPCAAQGHWFDRAEVWGEGHKRPDFLRLLKQIEQRIK